MRKLIDIPSFHEKKRLNPAEECTEIRLITVALEFRCSAENSSLPLKFANAKDLRQN
jgi:hypothetical protein